MQVGDKIMFVPYALRAGVHAEIKAKPVPGVVVWIHPEGRYAVVERHTGVYTYRESLPLTRVRRKEHYENDRNYEPEGRGRKDRHGPQFGRRAPAVRPARGTGGL